MSLHTGDLIKTLLHGYKPINMIGKREMYNPESKLRNKDILYKLIQENYPELNEDLIITGCHSILVNSLKNNEKEEIIKLFDDIYVTDAKYRLPACIDINANIYDKEGTFTIYHIALDNDYYYGNYGIYANGLLVETCSKRTLKELSDMVIL